MTTVLKSHGHTPTWVKGTTNHLRAGVAGGVSTNRVALSRLAEGMCVPLAGGGRVAGRGARDLLGHRNIGAEQHIEIDGDLARERHEKAERYQQQLADALDAAAETQAGAELTEKPRRVRRRSCCRVESDFVEAGDDGHEHCSTFVHETTTAGLSVGWASDHVRPSSYSTARPPACRVRMRMVST